MSRYYLALIGVLLLATLFFALECKHLRKNYARSVSERISLATDSRVEFAIWMKRLSILKEHRYDDLLQNLSFESVTSLERLNIALAHGDGDSYQNMPFVSKTGLSLFASVSCGVGGSYGIHKQQQRHCRANLLSAYIRRARYSDAERVLQNICIDELIDLVSACDSDKNSDAQVQWRSCSSERAFLKGQCGADLRSVLEFLEESVVLETGRGDESKTIP